MNFSINLFIISVTWAHT